MRIYYVANSYVPSREANSIHVMRMCEAFAESGNDVTLFAGRGSTDGSDVFRYYGSDHNFDLVPLLRPRIPLFRSAVYARQVTGALNRLANPDLLYGRDPFTLAFLAADRCPIIYEAHSPPNRLRVLFEQQIFAGPRFSHLVVISEALRTEYLKVFPASLTPDKVCVAPDAARETAAPTPVPLNARSGALQVGYVGHLYAGRGIDLIVRIAEELTEIDFHVIGGREEDVRRWRERASHIPHLRFHGFVAPAETGRWRAAMDVLLAPYQSRVTTARGGGDTSRWMSPLKLFEYMESGKAILASRLPVLQEFLHDEATCLLVAPDDLAGWCNALRRLKESHLRELLGQNARATFLERHTWAARVDQVLAYVSDTRSQVAPAQGVV